MSPYTFGMPPEHGAPLVDPRPASVGQVDAQLRKLDGDVVRQHGASTVRGQHLGGVTHLKAHGNVELGMHFAIQRCRSDDHSGASP